MLRGKVIVSLVAAEAAISALTFVVVVVLCDWLYGIAADKLNPLSELIFFNLDQMRKLVAPLGWISPSASARFLSYFLSLSKSTKVGQIDV